MGIYSCIYALSNYADACFGLVMFCHKVVKCVSAICGQDGTGSLSTARPLRLQSAMKLEASFNWC